MKIAVFFRRLLGGSFKRFFRNLNLVHQESGKNRFVLFVDMVYCMFAYGIGYLDYLTFGFAYISHEKRKTFMTLSDNVVYTKRLNQPEKYAVLEDKSLFYQTYHAYIRRAYVDIRQGRDVFADFCRDKETVFAKKPISYGGIDVRKIVLKEHDLNVLYGTLMENEMYLVEDTIVQHPEMNKLCAACVNTVRIVTVLSDKGNPNMVYSLVRIGCGEKEVDNVSSGGMYTLLSPDGEITHPAFCEKDVTYHTTHPATGMCMQGFRIPYYREAVQMCLDAAMVEPTLRYIGWDVAITENGPVLVEGNDLPGYDMCQNHRFHDDGCGILPAFEAALNH